MSEIDFSTLPNKAPDYDLEKLLEAGCHFGHQRSKWHPKMKPFIYMQKDGVDIFDLAKTRSQLQLAYNYIYNLAKQKKNVIFIGTKKRIKDIVKATAEEAKAMHITSRWLGGILTNFEQISSSINKMKQTEEGLKTGKFKKYTKYERVQMEKQLQRQLRFFEGLRNLNTLPDCLVIVDPKREKNAIHEARQLDIPIVAIIDSDGDPSLVDIAIPANDEALASVELIIKELTTAYKMGSEAK